MRKSRDGEDTKQRVLSSARELFAAKGYAGTSLADISNHCGISDGLILHHFQSKKNLYRSVLEILAREYAQIFIHAKESSASPRDMVHQTLAAAFNYWKQDSTYNRISLWSYLEGQTELADKEAQFTRGIYQEVKLLQEQGFIDDRFSPVVILTMAVGSIHFWMRFREQFKTTLDLPETPDELDQQFLNQLVQLIMEISQKPK